MDLFELVADEITKRKIFIWFDNVVFKLQIQFICIQLFWLLSYTLLKEAYALRHATKHVFYKKKTPQFNSPCIFPTNAIIREDVIHKLHYSSEY